VSVTAVDGWEIPTFNPLFVQDKLDFK